ncbi:head GIN domain-containing protein [Sphingomonas bacterium]|uniref:head GIN domain-containing protein n=1 Tax=Sphingomonas bacterium TaxID=1895847 RepID=UPI0015769E16|nr:head GIN domain-containing protein [Sphingomonas bacterium]
MRLTTLLAATLLTAALSGCSAQWNGRDDGTPGIAASGSGGERHYPVTGFSKVALGAAGDVEVRTGQSFGLTVTGDARTLDTVKVTQDDGTLELGRNNGVHWDGRARIRWLVTMPRIDEASIGGSGSIGIDKVEGGSFQGDIGGSGKIDVAGMKVDKAGFSIGGSGTITAAGTAKALDLSIGGSGKLHATPLAAETAAVSIAGAGTVEATVKTHADVTILGSGDVTIAGGAKCSVTKMGGGTVRCG